MTEYDSWASDYDAWSAGMTEDIPFYTDLVREADGPVVELMVGTGRVAIPAARATGKRIVGIDSSPAMLEVARERAGDLSLDLRLGDVCDLELGERAALVYIPFRSLLHVPGWRARRRLFERVAASLRPGGRFAFNGFVFDPKLAVEQDGATIVQNGIEHTVRHVPADNRIELAREGADTLHLWWWTRPEIEGLLEIAGLEIEALYGWFDRRPFDETSREMVWIARKP
ncbi:MAG: class I SAM-dependent methyltransferase [Actinomycetota bacterium]